MKSRAKLNNLAEMSGVAGLMEITLSDGSIIRGRADAYNFDVEISEDSDEVDDFLRILFDGGGSILLRNQDVKGYKII